MTVGWSALTFTPSSETVAALRASWSWMLPHDCRFLLFSIFGDAFFCVQTGEVFWLNTGTAEISLVAQSPADFRAALSGHCSEWFLPHLVEQLRSDGKVPIGDECYTYAVLPIFAEGKYEPWNFKVVPATEHFSLTGHVHREIAALPDGARVRMLAAS